MSELRDDPETPLDLAPLDVDRATAARIRAAAHAELQRAARPGARRTLRRAWRRAELPLVASLAVAYVLWAVQSVLVVTR